MPFARWLVRLAPNPLRRVLQSDGLLTLAEVRSGARRHGLWHAAWTTIAEFVDLCRTVLRARLRRTTPIGGGITPRPPQRNSRMPFRWFRRDLPQAWRALASTRGTALLAAVTLALGIGVNTAVFSVLDSLLFRPVPYVHADRLVALWSFYGPGKFQMEGEFAAATVVEWRKQADLFDRVEATQRKSFIFGGDRHAVMVTGSLVTPGLFSLLGVAPSAGRIFTDSDGRGGTAQRVIVSDRFWRERLGRDPDVVGRTIVLDGARYDVVGVMPATFRYPDETHDLWLPFDVAQPPPVTGRVSLAPIARMRPDIPRDQVAAQVIARGEAVTRAAGGEPQLSARVAAIGELFDENTARSLWVLGAAVLFLLLIVCANVANLTLARSMGRTRDLAVRSALGASRRDLFRVAFLEHLLLGAVGALFGLAFASAAIAAVVSVLPSEMTGESLNAIDLDWRTLAFLMISTLATVLVFGLPPAWLASRPGVSAALGRESRASTGSPAARRLRAALVVVEVALSIILVVGAALMTRSLVKLQAIDIGMDPKGLIKLNVGFPTGPFDDTRARDLATADIVRRLQQTPGVVRASAGGLPPREGMITVGILQIDDLPPTSKKSTMLRVYDTWPGYFAAAGIPLLEGREPVDGDVTGAAVVSREFAEKYWPGRSAIGARFKVGQHPPRTVVGVAAEVRRMSETSETGGPEIYFPHDQVSGVFHAMEAVSAIKEYRTILIRVDERPVAVRNLGRAVHDADPRVIVSRASFVEREVADAIARPRIVFLMMAVFAAVGLALAIAGLYGVLSYLVSSRQREIGVRLALGARPADIARLVLRSGLAMAGLGLVIGVAGAAALVRLMRTLLYDVEPSDPASVLTAVAVIGLAGLAASLIPARRAMRVDPVRLLRDS